MQTGRTDAAQRQKYQAGLGRSTVLVRGRLSVQLRAQFLQPIIHADRNHTIPCDHPLDVQPSGVHGGTSPATLVAHFEVERMLAPSERAFCF